MSRNIRNRTFLTITQFGPNTMTLSYPHESDNTILFPILGLILFTLFVGVIGIPFKQDRKDFDILSEWLTLSIKLFKSKFK